MKKIAGLIICLLWIRGSLPAHGVAFHVRYQFPAVVVQVRYDGGGPIPFAPVKVAAGREAIEFASGRTDGSGGFSFTPDRPGRWAVSADDEMGHRGTTEFWIGEDFFRGKISATGRDSRPKGSLLIRLLAGIILILGLSALFYRWKKGRQDRLGNSGGQNQRP